MSRIAPRTRAELAEHEEGFVAIEAFMGFVPTSLLAMAHVPRLLERFTSLAEVVFTNGLLPADLVQLVGHVTSAASGCRYCQAHTAAHAAHLGVDEAKLAELWSFETSDRFDAAERAALRFAFHAGQHPNAVGDEDLAACREHFDDAQITAIVAVCALFGFLNRWNDTMATTLEDVPRSVADRVLAPQGWDVGKHA